MGARARYRALLVVAVLVLAGAAVPIAQRGAVAQDGGTPFGGGGPRGPVTPAGGGGPFTAAFAQLGAPEGAVGAVVLPPDTPEAPGGACGTYRDPSPAVMEVVVELPSVSTAGATAQTVGFWVDLWQAQPDGTVTYVGSSSEHRVPATPGEPVDPGTYAVTDLPVGPVWLPVVVVAWYDDPAAAPSGLTAYAVESLGNWINRGGQWTLIDVADACYPLVNPLASLSPTSGPVNTAVTFRLYYFPVGVPVVAMWDARVLSPSTTATDATGRARGTFAVPDGQVMGPHTVSFAAGDWRATRTFTVTPRIKVTPGTVLRGQEVKISLRGYKARETVRVRWRDGGGAWREVARITTSGTGSGQVYLPVPPFAPDGPNAVRGDSLATGGGRAQTNAVTVTGGAFRAAGAQAATPAAATPDASPAAGTPAPAASPVVETPTPEPTEEPTAEPTTEPTVEPTPEPTAEPPTETPAAPGTPVAVSLTDFAIEMPDAIPAGPTTFAVTNDGAVEHGFAIAGQGVEAGFETTLQPGETRTLAVDLAPGVYAVSCPVGTHGDLGMRRELTVTEG